MRLFEECERARDDYMAAFRERKTTISGGDVSRSRHGVWPDAALIGHGSGRRALVLVPLRADVAATPSVPT
jgi:hypothetical protein